MKYLYVLIPFFLSSCAGIGVRRESPEIAQKRARVVDTARAMLGKKEIIVNQRKFNYDCSGLVRAVYCQSLGIDLFKTEDAAPDMNGTSLLYRYCRENGRIYTKKIPRDGDIVFFDYTLDVNNDGRYNHKLTHSGIVENTDEEGNVGLIHLTSKGIVRGRMNLKHPNEYKDEDSGEVINEYLSRKGKKKPPKKRALAGDVFRAFGSVFE